jgi:hypothetical protein
MSTLTRLESKKIRLVGSKQPYNAVAPSRNAGRFFNTYQFNGVRFTVDTEDPFNELFAKSTLYEVDIEEFEEAIIDKATGKPTKETVKRIKLLNYLSHEDIAADDDFETARTLKHAKVEAQIAVYKRQAVAEYEELA